MTIDKALASANAAMDGVRKRVMERDADVMKRTVARAGDKAWRRQESLCAEDDGVYRAALDECAGVVANAFRAGIESPRLLLVEGGATQLAPSPDLVALAARWREDRRVLAFDAELEGLLKDFPESAEGNPDDLAPGVMFVAWPDVLEGPVGSPKLAVEGFFAMVAVETDDKGEPAKKSTLVAVESGPRKRMVVADPAAPNAEGSFESALLRAACAPLGHLASDKPDVEHESVGGKGSSVKTALVGANLGPEVRKRRRLLRAASLRGPSSS